MSRPAACGFSGLTVQPAFAGQIAVLRDELSSRAGQLTAEIMRMSSTKPGGSRFLSIQLVSAGQTAVLEDELSGRAGQLTAEGLKLSSTMQDASGFGSLPGPQADAPIFRSAGKNG